jgi:hypothetical protein
VNYFFTSPKIIDFGTKFVCLLTTKGLSPNVNDVIASFSFY